MQANCLDLGNEYYQLVGGKNLGEVKKRLHPDVELISPMAVVKGREAVCEATGNFMKSFASLTIRAKFGSESQAMIVYETDIPGIANEFPGASLLSFRDGLIVRIQLFYDGSRFLEKSKEIFK